jgi:two-component system, cell cycle sensor histidine kinase and response regulator CckA
MGEAGDASYFHGVVEPLRVLHVEDVKTDAEQRAAVREAIGTLAAGIAHDLNNLLSIIVSSRQLLAADLEPNDPGRDELEEILSAGTHAADVMRRLLAFGRKQILGPRIVDLDAIVAGSEKLFRRVLGEDIELTVVAGRSRARVLADSGQIDRVLMNLVINARDAMPHGGKLVIETSSVGPDVLLTVRDTGVGMTAATRARVFEPFFTTKERGKGTGLGLSIVKGIVDQSGGRIRVSSEAGQGTTFEVSLPSPPRPTKGTRRA